LFLDAVNTPAVEMQRALEFAEFLGQPLEPGSHEQQAQQQLLASLGSLSRTLHRQEMEMSSLRHSNVALGKKREVLEAELAAAREFQEDVRELQEERDEERRRAEALEHQVVALRHECLHSSQELERLKASTEDVHRQRADSERRDWQWRDRCGQLEQAADTAEGQARWMSEEIGRLKGELSGAREGRESLTSEIERLRKLLEAASDSIRSHTAYATESDECIKELRRQLDAAGGAAPGGGKASSVAAPAARRSMEASEPQDNVQQTQLDLLRSMRDELLRLDDSWAEVRDTDDAADSPRHLQAQRRCRFLELQVQALLRHTQAVERVLDAQRDAHLGPSPDVRRRLSIQRVQQDGEALFNELSERLHTLEVQKADADQEVQRLQAGNSELRRELSASQQSREELLLELRVARHESMHSVHEELRACLKGEDLYLGGEPSTTSETRSVSSSGYARGGDSSDFLTEAHGALHPSPKGAFTAGVNKVINANFLAAAADRSSRRANSGAGEQPRRSHRRQGQEEDSRRSERAPHGKKKAEGDCEMQ